MCEWPSFDYCRYIECLLLDWVQMLGIQIVEAKKLPSA